jgi:pimeloyl-ACP methyl ester carboxylesterase
VTGVPILTASDDVAIHYEILGSQTDEAGADLVVLLHGLSQQRHFWGPVVAGLDHGPTVRTVVVDQRGHGDSDAPLGSDFSIERCAQDIRELIASLRPRSVVLVGHSWGASVALRSAVLLGSSCAAVVLIDGGVFGPAMLGDRDDVRELLRPPELGLPLEEILAMMRSGDLGPSWSAEVEDALRPTFVIDADGRARTRLGVPRHMQVLEGMFDYSPEADLTALAEPGSADVWVVGCEARPDASDDSLGWSAARMHAYERVSTLNPSARVLRWIGAVHDVPLQWPTLVSGLVTTALTEARRERRGA